MRPGKERRAALAASLAFVGALLAPHGAAVAEEPGRYELTVDGIGLDGAPAGDDWSVVVQNVDTGETSYLDDEAGTGTVEVPAGDYLVTSDMGWIGTESAMDLTVQTRTLPELAADTAITFDARRAEEIDLSVFDRAAEQTTLTLVTVLTRGDGYTSTTFWNTFEGADSTFRTQHTGPSLGEGGLRSVAAASWLNPDTGTEYHAAHERTGTFFTGLDEHERRRDLARVDLGARALAGGARGRLHFLYELVHDGHFAERELPGTTTAYLTPGRWGYGLDVTEAGGDSLSFEGALERYAAGERRRVEVGAPVFGPGLGARDGLSREGDEIAVGVGLFSDDQGNRGAAGGWESASVVVRRDGEVYATSDRPLNRTWIEVPPEEAEYELTTTVRRDAAALVSTEVTASFTFASGHAGTSTELPMSVVRFTPRLGEGGTVPAGRRTVVPVTVQGTAAAEGGPSALSVEVSHDRGDTWRSVQVRDGAVAVDNPAAGGTVSFRAHLTDRGGNTTELTVVDAYRTV
ncbi:hypothetical protein [Streptomyces hainanensis]|uniref:Uncharacterized protein n=1 Tax=Streptomyces hainanensis TaxID=402648 RepID=A0A4R4TNH7_9ACTN|nr:hypothetical protein [Streptomyces hainanensis]TDC76852.1 hypothetical protein E1283_08825 [Streptomyces hainanensis]